MGGDEPALEDEDVVTAPASQMQGARPNSLAIAGAGLVLVLIAVLNAFSQPAFNDLAGRVMHGSSEEKRNALMAIRNARSAEISRLAIPALTDRDEIVRATAAASVIALEDAGTYLVPLLADRSEMVRREAAFALGEARATMAIQPLAEVTRKDKSVEVRNAAIIALGKIGDIRSLDVVTSVLRAKPNDDNEFTRRSAARSIGQIADAAAADQRRALFASAARMLIGVLGSAKESDDTHREAAAALGSVGDPSAIAQLKASLRSQDPYLIAEAERSLKRMNAYP